MRGQKTDPELVAKVEAALLAGMALSAAAREYKLPVSSVARIKENLDQSKLEKVGKETRRRIDDMLADSLEAHLAALKGIAEVAKDKNYIQKQPANDIAALHQRLEEHALRLLESAGLAEESGGEE